MKKIYLGIVLGVVFLIGIMPVVNSIVVLGNNSGFVTVAPTSNPSGTFNTLINDRAMVIKDTSDASAVKITEVGWWADGATEETNFEVGLYADDGAFVPGEAGTLLQVSRTNAKGTTSGWKTASVDWSIDSSTVYWIGVQVDNTASFTRIDQESSGTSTDVKSSQTTLTNPFGGESFINGLFSIYAVWEAETPSSFPTKVSLYENNHLQIAGGHLEIRG